MKKNSNGIDLLIFLFLNDFFSAYSYIYVYMCYKLYIEHSVWIIPYIK